MRALFTKHPASMGETYFQHFKCAFHFGTRMLIGGFACLIHAFFPFLFKSTGSNFLFRMAHDFIERSPSAEERMHCLAKSLELKIDHDRH